MKYVPGPAFGEFRGSQGNTTASRNRFGAYLRNRVNPVQPQTPRQTFIRNTLTDLAAAWRSLTAGQLLDWANLGAQIERTNTLGQIYTLTGLQAYIMTNSARINMGEASVDDAPILDVLPAILTATITATEGGAIALTYTAQDSPAGARLSIFMTDGFSAGRNFIRRSEFRWLVDAAGNVVSPFDVTAVWTAKFGSLLAGEQVAMLIQPWSPNRLPSTPVRATTIVEA